MSVLLSVRPEWGGLILSGKKTIEVRRSAPTKTVCEVFIYCTARGPKLDYIIDGVKTRMNGHVVAKAALVSARHYCALALNGLWDYGINTELLRKTCVSEQQMSVYGSGRDVYLWELSGIEMIGPYELADYGLKKAPRSWAYCTAPDDDTEDYPEAESFARDAFGRRREEDEYDPEG